MATTKALAIDTWPSFVSYLLRRYERFVSEQSESWQSICELLDTVVETHRPPGDLASAATLAEAAARFERAGRQLLVSPYESCSHLHPIARALNAIEDLDREVSAHAGGAEHIAGTQKASLSRARIDGAMQLLLSQACLRIGESWNAYLSSEVGLRKARDGGAEDSRARTIRERAQAAQILERDRRWIEDALIDLNLHRDHRRARKALTRTHEHHLEFWRARQRPISSFLELEIGIWAVALSCLRTTDAVVNEFKRESNDLRVRLRLLTQYLEQWTAEPFDPPAIDARIAGPEERIEGWQSRVSRIILQQLPERTVVPQPRSELPSVIERNRTSRPRKMYLNALRFEVLPVLEEQVQSRVLFHMEVAATLVRAEEVIRYAIEASEQKPNPILAEALRNTISLLKECDESPEWDWNESEASIARALMICSCEVFVHVRSGLLGDAALIARWLRLQFTGAGRRSTIRRFRLLMRPAFEVLARRSDALLVEAGWNEPPRELPSPVRVRSELRPLNLARSATHRSALYSQLFELTPVEDPRFLVGREAEMDGFSEAYEAWRRGDFATCVLVGTHGSGKSSLLSCALPRIEGNEPILRCEINERLRSSEDMERSLRSLLNTPERVGLVEGIGSNRRAIVLTGVERAFLRSIGGFEAIRALVQLIHATSSAVFWIVVLDAGCFELLDAAVDFGDFFSHRINAMGVPSEAIERAILQRHALSGLKLSFPELHRHALQTALGWRGNPQKAFFSALHRNSGGIFRSALELWLSSIESAEDGVIRLREPVAPDYRAFRHELGQADQFALLSLEQHGSLTVSELAIVLFESEQVSRTRLDRLIRMGILEWTPERPEVRIRRGAQRTAEQLLESVNLI
jgi:hypothetical protein